MDRTLLSQIRSPPSETSTARQCQPGGYALARRQVLAGLLAGLAPAAAGAAPSDEVGALRDGGHVIYLRHARTVMHPEPKVLDLADCSWQRNLNEEGREEAQLLRTRIRELGIPVGIVLSSPFCRARDTAEIVFGRYEIWTPLAYHANQTPEQHYANVATIKARLAQRPPPGQTLVMVGHEPGFRDGTGIRLSEGEASILEPTNDGGLRDLWHLTARGLRKAV